VHPQSLQGEARETGRWLAGTVKRLLPVNWKRCLLFGGETAVTVRGRGEGGPNLELALGFALETRNIPGVTMMALGTDGKDGSSPAAGAIISKNTFAFGSFSADGAERALDANDSYTYLAQMKATLYTGPTGTNVADVVCILLEPP
jgi:glycerate-2-kinase